MSFIDSAKIYIKAGSGGRGCSSFYRDKYTRQGIADGGDGGRGADIIIRADRNLHTLLDFQFNRHFTGKHGQHGSGNKKKGKNALSVIVHVPCGTTVKDLGTNCTLRDLTQDADQVVAAKGGAGGLGNRSRREATDGIPGEERQIQLELKLIADAGLVGWPNAGKSTLISHISNAHPKIAAYPFTTLSPVLGVVHAEHATFVLADIPGLIEGSCLGRGLGDKFLRHIERTHVLVHLVDMSGTDGRDPVDDYRAINKELEEYGSGIAKKTQIIVANKMDLEVSKRNFARFKKALPRKKIYPISALEKQGLEDLIEAIAEKL